MTVTRKWSLLAAVLVVAIAAGGWFLLVSPKRSEAASLRSDTETQEQQNARLRSQIQQLIAQQADLPEQRARLAELQKQIPGTPALPSLIRGLTEAGRKTGANLDSLAPSAPVAVVDLLTAATPTAPAASTSTGTGTTSSEGTSTTTVDAATAPAAPTTVLFAVPIEVEVTGSYFELEQFVNQVEKLKRAFLVNGFTLGEAEGAVATDDALTIAIKGSVFLAPPAEQVQTPTTTAPAATTPVAE